MIDTQKKYLQQALDTKYHETLGVKSKEYVLITLHRPSNVDDLDKLKEIFDDFEELSKTEKLALSRAMKCVSRTGFTVTLFRNGRSPEGGSERRGGEQV